MNFFIFAFILLLSLPATMVSSQETVIFSAKVGECDLTVESQDQGHVLRLRAHHPEYKNCHIDKDSMLSALDAAFSKTGLPKLEVRYSSLFLGRLIDYPWLSQYLAIAADNDTGWNSKRGKPATGDINKYVSQVLSRKELLAQIEAVLAKGGYRVIGTSVEKVLVGGFRDVPLYQGKMVPRRVPYDAMVWFRLEKN